MKYVVFLEYFRLIKTYQTELGPIRKVGICLDPKNPVLPGGAQHSSSVFASARIAPAVATTSEHKPSRQIFQMIHYSLTFQPRIGASFFAHSGRICGLHESNASYMSCMGLWPPLPPLFPEAPDLMRSKFLHTSGQYETVWKSGWVSGPMRSFNYDWVVDNFCYTLWERKKETNEDSSKLGQVTASLWPSPRTYSTVFARIGYSWPVIGAINEWHKTKLTDKEKWRRRKSLYAPQSFLQVLWSHDSTSSSLWMSCQRATEYAAQAKAIGPDNSLKAGQMDISGSVRYSLEWPSTCGSF